MKYFSENLNDNLLNDFFKKIVFKKEFVESDDFKNCDDDILRNLISNKKNIIKGRSSKVFQWAWAFSHITVSDIENIKNFVEKKINKKVVNTALLYYPVNGYMTWHTNSNFPGERIYLVFSETGESYFKYLDSNSNEVIKMKDNIGWSMNRFFIPTLPEHFWHCVCSKTNRISVGFRVLN